MRSNETTYTQLYFGQKLSDYLRMRHPEVKNPRGLIERRSLMAFDRFRLLLRAGANIPAALGEADRILYSGLIFSRFDMV